MGTYNYRFLESTGLIRYGAFLPVELSLPTAIERILREAGLPYGEPLRGAAVVDTGADATCIARTVPAALQSRSIGHWPLRTPGGSYFEDLHLVRFRFPELAASVESKITITADMGSDLTPEGAPIVAIIGRDLLALWRFTWDGPAGAWSVST